MVKERALAESVPGEELDPIEFVLTPEMVDFYVIGIDDRHPWYTQGSPFGGRIAPPPMVHTAKLRMWQKHYTGHSGDARMHIRYNAEYMDPARVGEKITIRGRCLDNYVKRGRKYVSSEWEMFGEDGRLLARYRDETLLRYRKEGE